MCVCVCERARACVLSLSQDNGETVVCRHNQCLFLSSGALEATTPPACMISAALPGPLVGCVEIPR